MFKKYKQPKIPQVFNSQRVNFAEYKALKDEKVQFRDKAAIFKDGSRSTVCTWHWLYDCLTPEVQEVTKQAFEINTKYRDSCIPWLSGYIARENEYKNLVAQAEGKLKEHQSIVISNNQQLLSKKTDIASLKNSNISLESKLESSETSLNSKLEAFKLKAIPKQKSIAIYKALSENMDDLVEELLKVDFDPLYKDPEGNTLLHHICNLKYNDTNIYEVLISKGVPLDYINNSNNTPLHIAAIKNNVEIAKILIEYGAALNTVNNDGDTALHSAIATGQKHVAKELIKAGASLDIVNNKGEKILDLLVKDAEYNAFLEEINLLPSNIPSLENLSLEDTPPHDQDSVNPPIIQDEYMKILGDNR